MQFELTETEAQRYDRQIRVWGAEAQSRIQNSKVLVAGLGKMNVEVVKNIVLAGMNVTLQSSKTVSCDDLSHNFFLGMDDVGKQVVHCMLPKVQELNSFAGVNAEENDLHTLPDTFFEGFSVILLTDCSEAQAVRINNICRKCNPRCVFFWSDMFGDEGLFYADFGESFTYKPDQQPSSNSNSNSSNSNNNNSSSSRADKSVADVASKAVKNMCFPSLEVLLSRKWCDLVSRFFPLSKTFVRHRLLMAFSDVHGRYPTPADSSTLQNMLSKALEANGIAPASPVLDASQLQRLCEVSGTASVLSCSVLGSYLSQEVVKAVSHSGEPAFNVFVFSAEDMEAKAFPVR